MFYKKSFCIYLCLVLALIVEICVSTGGRKKIGRQEEASSSMEEMQEVAQGLQSRPKLLACTSKQDQELSLRSQRVERRDTPWHASLQRHNSTSDKEETEFDDNIFGKEVKKMILPGED